MSTSIKKNKVNIKNSNEQEQESVITNAITFFQATSNNFALMAKAHFRGSSFYLGNLFIPFMITFGICGMMTITYGLTWMLYFSMTFTGLATYGTVFFEIRKSSLMKNLNLTSTESASLYCSTFMLIGVSLSITLFVVYFSALFFDKIGFASYEFEFYNNGNPLGIWYIDWSVLITQPSIWYYWIEQIILCFSLSFFVEKIVSTQKNFFIFAFAYILAGVFFAGIMSTTMYVGSDGVVRIIDDSTTLEELNGVLPMQPYLWGHGGWWASQFFPHYAANQFLSCAGQAASWHYDFVVDPSTGDYMVGPDGNPILLDEIVYNRWYNLNIFQSMDSWQMEYYAIAPWAWSALLIWISAVIERYDKNKD